MICESQIYFLISQTKNLQNVYFPQIIFLKYDHFKIISVGDICLLICLELNE